MSRLEYTWEDGHTDVTWTDMYGTEIKEGSLITYCVKGSYRMSHYRARVISTNTRNIAVEVQMRNGGTRKTRLYATQNIIVYAQAHRGLMLNVDNSFTDIEEVVV